MSKSVVANKKRIPAELVEVSDIVHNLHTFYSCATESQLEEGVKWYHNARCMAQDWAGEFGLTLESVVGVIAVLSPLNGWDSNVRDARAVLECARDSGDIESVKVSTFRANKLKAWRMATGESPESVVKGDKVSRFYQNILTADCIEGDTDSESTIDIWAVRAAAAVFDQNTMINLSSAVYDKFNQAYQTVARQVGLTAKQLQAIVWVVVRDFTTGQGDQLRHNLQMFCPNCFGSPHEYKTIAVG